MLGEFSINVFGEHNVVNALASITVGLELGMDVSSIQKGLAMFKGSKRRSEFLGTSREGALVYDDYGHHPQEIESTLASFKKRFPDKKIVCIFQPHMYSRTKTLLAEFIQSFKDADEVIISEIFPSAREQRDPNFSASLIVEGINKNKNKAIFLSSLDNVVKYMDENPPKMTR